MFAWHSFGEAAASLASEGIAFGADSVYAITHAGYEEFNGDSYTGVISGLCSKITPVLCLLGQTDLGRDVAPRLAARTGGGACHGLRPGRFRGRDDSSQTRPAYGGKALCVMASGEGLLQIDTIRAKSMASAVSQEGRAGETMVWPEAPDAAVVKAKLLEAKKTEAEGVKLEDAKVIVSGGGGLGGVAGFDMIRQLADLLGGVVGATRVPVDENWVPLSMEIGQTGKIVRPRPLYRHWYLRRGPAYHGLHQFKEDRNHQPGSRRQYVQDIGRGPRRGL